MSGLKFLHLVSVLLLLSLRVGAEQPSDIKRELGELVPSLMAQAHIPGVSIAYVKDGQPLWSRGFGVTDTKTNSKVTPSTRFEAASLSKPVLAYIVMKFVARGGADTGHAPSHPISSPEVHKLRLCKATHAPFDIVSSERTTELGRRSPGI